MLFVHGLWTTGAESFLLKRHLAAQGWVLRVFRYSSLGESMERVARRCARQALQLAQQTEMPVHLLGHSLGGIVVHRMFDTGLLAADRFSGDFCRVIFAGTPARGSSCARVLARHALARQLLGRAGAQDLLQGLPQRWSFDAQLGVIAGNRSRGVGRMLTRLDEPNDGTVCVAETCIEGATDCCVLPVSHIGMCLSRLVAMQAAAFLDHGRFDQDASIRMSPS